MGAVSSSRSSSYNGLSSGGGGGGNVTIPIVPQTSTRYIKAEDSDINNINDNINNSSNNNIINNDGACNVDSLVDYNSNFNLKKMIYSINSGPDEGTCITNAGGLNCIDKKNSMKE